MSSARSVLARSEGDLDILFTLSRVVLTSAISSLCCKKVQASVVTVAGEVVAAKVVAVATVAAVAA